MGRETDDLTGLEVAFKQPVESRTYTFNFEKLLQTTSITGIVSIVSENQGRVTGSTDVTLTAKTHNSAELAQVRIADGQDCEDYKIVATVNTSDSDTLQMEGILKVRDL